MWRVEGKGRGGERVFGVCIMAYMGGNGKRFAMR